MEVVVDYLKTKEGAVVEVRVDKDSNFKSILFQDQYMKDAYGNFPEILLVDATYKLLDLRMPLYVLMTVDGDGLSDIVGLLIVAEESEAVITSAMESFKRHNPAWIKTTVIMSDKDFTERQAFAKCFPDSSLLICLYHTLRTFRREITVEKMGITSSERDRALEIMTKIVYSTSEEAYEANVALLKETKWKWKQWVSCFKDSIFNLGEMTNNRLESANAKIKSVCSRYGTLLQFFTEMFAVLGALRNERTHQQLMGLSRLPIDMDSYEEDLRAYANILTPYAFKHLKKQMELAKIVTVQQLLPEDKIVVKSHARGQVIVTPNTCECTYPVKMGLPCRHILKARNMLKLSRFDPTLFSTRLTVEYYNRAAGKSDAPTSSSSNVEVVSIEKKCATLTQAQKFHQAMNRARTPATLASDGGMKTFKTRMADLQSLINLWQTQDRVRKTEDDSGTSSATNNGIKPTQSKKKSNKKSKERKQFLSDHEKDCDDKSNIIPPSRTDLQAKSSQPKEIRDIQEEGRGKQHVRKEMNGIKMPKNMLKRGRPKGAELTVIGLPKSKKGLLPFSKVRAEEKDRIFLECFVRHSVANTAVKSGYLISAEEVESNIHKIPDMIRDKENVDLPRIENFLMQMHGKLFSMQVRRKASQSGCAQDAQPRYVTEMGVLPARDACAGTMSDVLH